MNKKRFWFLLGAIALIGAAFLLLNFRLAVSGNQTAKLIFVNNMGDHMPASMKRNDKIRMVVVGDGPMVGALQRALMEKLGKAGLGEIELVRELDPGYQDLVLVVKVDRPAPLWTPLIAISRFSVQAGYASNGDTTFMEEIRKTRTSVGKPDVANMYAGFEVNDQSLGLISRQGYHQYLADYLAHDILNALVNLYNG